MFIVWISIVYPKVFQSVWLALGLFLCLSKALPMYLLIVMTLSMVEVVVAS